jgi:hypothetical protein
MVSLRDVLAPVLEARVASALRLRLTLQRARRDASGTNLSAQHQHVKILQETDLEIPSGPVRSAELFILGAGPSALELSQANRERMRAGTTIGLNSWVLHDFIPDAYSFEKVEDDHYVSVAAGLSVALARKEVIFANPLVLHLRSPLGLPSRRLVSVPPELHHNTRYYGRVNVETREIRNLDADLIALLRSQRSGAIAPHVLIDSGMSVARMVSLGVLRGYRSIVLVGVDLNSSRYFFEEDPSYLTRHNLEDFNPWIFRTANHGTEETVNRNFAASTFIPALARASLAAGGPRVYVGSPSSKLAKDLEAFAWAVE